MFINKFRKGIFLSLLFMLLLPTLCLAGDVTRSHNFTDGEVLTAAQLDTAFDEIIIEVNDLDSDNLAVDLAITTSGNMTLTGAFHAYGGDNKIGNGGSDALVINTPNGITYTPAATWTFTGDQTISGTWADLGIVTTSGAITIGGKLTAGANEVEGSNFDINGGAIDGVTLGGASQVTITDADINSGTLDNVQIGGVTATGELLVNDSSDHASGLGSQGTGGQYFKSNGAGANPSWDSFSFSETFGVNGTFTVPTGITNLYITMVAGGGGGGGAHAGTAGGGSSGEFMIRHLYATTGGSTITVTVGAGGAGASAGNYDGNDGNDVSFGTLTVLGGAGGKQGDTGAGGALPKNFKGVDGADGGEGGREVLSGGGGGGSIFGVGGKALASGAYTGFTASANTGAGGGGASDSGGAIAGGNGGSGFVLVEW